MNANPKWDGEAASQAYHRRPNQPRRDAIRALQAVGIALSNARKAFDEAQTLFITTVMTSPGDLPSLKTRLARIRKRHEFLVARINRDLPLRGHSLWGMDLRWIDFSGLDIRHCDLRGALLEGAYVDHAVTGETILESRSKLNQLRWDGKWDVLSTMMFDSKTLKFVFVDELAMYGTAWQGLPAVASLGFNAGFEKKSPTIPAMFAGHPHLELAWFEGYVMAENKLVREGRLTEDETRLLQRVNHHKALRNAPGAGRAFGSAVLDALREHVHGGATRHESHAA